MRNIFLYGDVGSDFKNNIAEFLNCSKDGYIALLMMNKESNKYEELYGVPITEIDRKYVAVYPENNGKLCRDDLEIIYNASGILMAGGNPRVYSDTYTLGIAGELIKRKYYNGTPYAGVSAGAILTGEFYEETVKTANIGDNQIFLASKFNPKVSNGKENIEKVQGFGFLKEIFLEPHFSEWGLFPALLNKLNDCKYIKTGIGFDENIGIKGYFNKGGVTIIEWADLIPNLLPEERLDIKIRIVDDNKRLFIITPHGEEYENVCEQAL